MKIILASNNAGKIREFSLLLAPFNMEIIPQAEFNVPEIEETELTFIENALLKARFASKKTGLPAIADDSGLAVSALNGVPGIYSARYAGKQANSQENIQKLLADMKNVPDENRAAAFHCVLVFMSHYQDPTPILCDGKWSGVITRESRGTNGFGYDPVFYLPELQKTAAELPLEVKNKISHRGKALQSLLQALTEKI